MIRLLHSWTFTGAFIFMFQGLKCWWRILDGFCLILSGRIPVYYPGVLTSSFSGSDTRLAGELGNPTGFVVVFAWHISLLLCVCINILILGLVLKRFIQLLNSFPRWNPGCLG